jgi:hypothetical protein
MQKIQCPSASCSEGAQLIGLLGENKKVIFLGKPIPIDESFIKEANIGRPPEKRFRFSTNCASQQCYQWDSGRCGLADKLKTILNPTDANHPENTGLPNCGIRDACRWYIQLGDSGCLICPDVIRDPS